MDVGLEAEDFGHETIIIRSIPDVLKDADIASIISDIASSLRKSPEQSPAKVLQAHPGIWKELGRLRQRRS